MKKRHKIVPASYLIIIEDNKVLLSRRFNTGYRDGQYGFVSGHLDKKESFSKAAIREAKEEANIIILKKDLEVGLVMNRFEPINIKDDNACRIDIFFLVKKWKGQIKNMEPHKCDDLGWFPINKLPKNTIPYARQAINNIINKISYSEHGYK